MAEAWREENMNIWRGKNKPRWWQRASRTVQLWRPGVDDDSQVKFGPAREYKHLVLPWERLVCYRGNTIRVEASTVAEVITTADIPQDPQDEVERRSVHVLPSSMLLLRRWGSKERCILVAKWLDGSPATWMRLGHTRNVRLLISCVSVLVMQTYPPLGASLARRTSLRRRLCAAKSCPQLWRRTFAASTTCVITAF